LLSFNSETCGTAYWLSQFVKYGCEKKTYKNLMLAAAIMLEFAELESELLVV
jgi:hypothetical protein